MTGVPSEVPGKYNMDATANARSSIGKAITDHWWQTCVVKSLVKNIQIPLQMDVLASIIPLRTRQQMCLEVPVKDHMNVLEMHVLASTTPLRITDDKHA